MPAHHRQPSLPALRAFEAAARRLSFTEAAKELHVTQAAVSRHVRSLETTLGRTLFHRLYHRVELTAAGKHSQASSPPASSALDQNGVKAGEAFAR
jgi:LysR family glycine cleavage system transcriptional activator